METNIENNEDTHFKVYKRRYAVLTTVVILNISNAALWICYSPVATTVGNFYGVATEKVNWFSLVYLIVTMPFAFLSTFTIDKVGLKIGIYLGACLNCVGSVIKAIGTSSAVQPSAQYAVSLTGQVIAAMAQSFLLFIPTKVSQLWFPEDHRAISTTALAMSNPLGIVLAEVVVPFVVGEDEGKVPLNNYIWMGLAIVGMAATVVCVTRAKPKTPPSLSAVRGDETRPPYLQQLREVVTCVPYMLLLLSLGCGVGIFNAIATLTQQLLCPLGYSEVIGGAATAVMVLMGFVGSAVTGIMVDKNKKFLQITKTFLGFASFFLIIMMEFYLFPNQTAWLIVFCALFGFFGIGAYPIGLELAVEATYPVEESISTALIFLSGQVHGVIGIVMIPALAMDQDPSRAYLNVCDTEVQSYPKDYSLPLMIIMAYMTILVYIMISFMDTRYKRQEAEKTGQDRHKSNYQENKAYES